MQISVNTRVILQTDVQGGRVGDECLVVSSDKQKITVVLIGLEDIEFDVNICQIKIKR